MQLTSLTLSGQLQSFFQSLEVRRFVLLLDQSLLSALPDKLSANNPTNSYFPNDMLKEQRQFFPKTLEVKTKLDTGHYFF